MKSYKIINFRFYNLKILKCPFISKHNFKELVVINNRILKNFQKIITFEMKLYKIINF